MTYSSVQARPFREEFRLVRFVPRHDNAVHVASSPFVGNSILLAIRLLFLVFAVVVTIVSGINQADARWLIYLTNWTFLVLVVSLISSTLVSFYDLFREQGDEAGRQAWKWFHSLHLGLYTMAASLSITVTLLYWTLLNPSGGFVDISTHAINSVIVVADLMLSNTPIPILPVWLSLLYAVLYAIFSVIYTVSGGANPGNGANYIYKILDWSDAAGTAILYTLLTIVIVLPVIHFLTYLLFRLRIWLAQRFGNAGTTTQPEGTMAMDDMA